jgi:2-polyprenyl-6-hydroxyphenyl methylase / 3-demethylubiquinone-9 3-methyltransferase
MTNSDTNVNVDAEEIAKFSEQAVHWWDSNGQFKALHQINPLRLHYIQSCTALTGKKVVDIGCGGGILTDSMAMQGALVTGLDMSKAALQVAELHKLETGTTIEYLHTTAESLAETRAQTYDVVTCLEMLEHVPNPQSIVQACAKLVKPQGHVFFSTLNRNLKAYLYAIIGAEYVLKLLPQCTHDFSKFIKPSELMDWVRKAGLTPLDISGMNYHLFTQRYTLGKDVSVNYLLHCYKE